MLLETLRSCTKVLFDDHHWMMMIFVNLIRLHFTEFKMSTIGSGRFGSFPWRGEVFHRKWIFCDNHPELLLHWKNPNARQVPSTSVLVCHQFYHVRQKNCGTGVHSSVLEFRTHKIIRSAFAVIQLESALQTCVLGQPRLEDNR